MEAVYDLHQHTHCVVIYFGRTEVTAYIFSTSNRYFDFLYTPGILYLSAYSYGSSVSYKENVGTDGFHNKVNSLFKKGKDTWDEKDKNFMKAIPDFLQAAVKNALEEKGLKVENFDLFHYAFIVPSEWEEHIRDDIIRPIFVQSSLISNEDHKDRLLFFSDIESIFYGLEDKNKKKYFFKRGQNIISCRISPNEEKIVIKFDLIQTSSALFNFPNARLFPRVIKSSSITVTTDDIEGRIKEYLRKKVFPVTAINSQDRRSLKRILKAKLFPFDQDQIIEAIVKQILRWNLSSLDKEREEKDMKMKPWITVKKRWVLTEAQKEAIVSLCPSVICVEISSFLFGNLKDIISNNFTKNYSFLLVTDKYSSESNGVKNRISWLAYMLEYNVGSLNSIVTTTPILPWNEDVALNFILTGAGVGAFEALQNSDIYCKPRIISSEEFTTSSPIFISSKSEVILNLDILSGSTLLAYLFLNEDGSIQQICKYDYFTTNSLPPLGYFYTFSNTTTLNVKEQFIPFAERYLLGDLSEFTTENGFSVKKDCLFEIETILTKSITIGEVIVSTNEPKYIKAFVLMYAIYVIEDILKKLPNQLISNHKDMISGYAVSIEAILLNNIIGTKDYLLDIIFASGLVQKGNSSIKLQVLFQGENFLPAIQKSMKLNLSLKSYFVLCQLYEDYVHLSLHQVVTIPSPEEKRQESIIVRDEIIAINNIYDSLCLTMWRTLVRDSSLIELCDMHDTTDDNEIVDLFSLNNKTEFFGNFKDYVSDYVLKNNPDVQNTTDANAVKLNNSCNCKVRLAITDIIDISFTPVLQNIGYTLFASLSNKELFGNYMNIDYLFILIHFSNNSQLQYAFTNILEEEADDFNLELGIDASCLVVPELSSELLQPVRALRPSHYKDFQIGALQQVCSENYVFCIRDSEYSKVYPTYKSKITDKKTIQCDDDTFFPLLKKGEIIHNAPSNKTFYLRSKNEVYFIDFSIEIFRLKTINNLENKETLFRGDDIFESVDIKYIDFRSVFEGKNVDVPVMISVSYISYTSSLQFSVKVVGADTRDETLCSVTEVGEPLTLTRF